MASFSLDGEVEQRYRILRHIGSGAYGVVWCALDLRTRRQVALKKVFDAFGNQQDAQRTFREVMLLEGLKGNPLIVGLLDVIRAANGLDLYLVFELLETDLTMILRKNILHDIHKRYLVYQTVKVVAQLHARGVIHRDLKPSNVFVNSDCTIKLGDFGLARTMNAPTDDMEEGDSMTDYIATRWYRSPENLAKSTAYTTAMDMWAVGCVISEILLGRPLFLGTSTAQQFALIIAAVGEPTEDDLESLKAVEVWTLLDSLTPQIAHEPLTERLKGCDDDAVDLVTRLIVFNPRRRLTALEALRHPYIAPFVTPADLAEIAALTPLTLPLPDDQHFSAEKYQNLLYKYIPSFRLRRF